MQVPFSVAREADVALYLDADAIVLCDLEELWDSFTGGAAADKSTRGMRKGWGGTEAMFAVAQDGPHEMYPTPYGGDPRRGGHGRKPTAAMYPRGINAGVCALSVCVVATGEAQCVIFLAGVLLMHLGRIRANLQRYWASVTEITRESGYRAPRLGNFSDGMAFYDQARSARVFCG